MSHSAPCPLANIELGKMFALLIGLACLARVVWVVLFPRLAKLQSSLRTPKYAEIQGKYPQSRWLLGIDFVLENIRANQKNQYLEHVQKTFQRLGNTWTTQALGTTMVESIEPENLKAVFSSDFWTWEQGKFRQETFKPLLGDGILSANGHAWEHSRGIVKKAFKSYTADTTIFEQHIENLVAVLPKNENEVVDLQSFFLKLTMDISTDVLFGTSVHSLLPEAKDFSGPYEVVKYNIFKNMQIYPLGWFRDQREMRAATRTVHDWVDNFVDDAMDSANTTKTDESTEKRYQFMHQLASDLKDRDKVRMELLSLLLAGRDTTAALVSNMFYILAQRSDIRSKIQAEVAELKGQLPKMDDLKRMQYLNYTVKESLRLHPVTPINSRTAAHNTTLPVGGGPTGSSPIFVPKGAQFVTSVHALHRRPDIWGPDAADFKPERWHNHVAHAWHYMPFLGGPRQCPGQVLATNITLYTVARLLQVYGDILPERAEAWNGAIAVTCWNANGTKVRLVPR